MNEKYWVRHRTLSGFAGPLTAEELAAAVHARTLPADSEVRLAQAGAAVEKLDAYGWTPAWRLLGVEPPPVPEPEVSLAPAGGAGARLQHLAHDLRRHSAYPGARAVARWVAVILTLVTAAVAVVGVVSAPTGQLSVACFAATAVLAWELAGLFLGYQVFLMLADIADCQLRQQTDRAVQRAGADGADRG